MAKEEAMAEEEAEAKVADTEILTLSSKTHRCKCRSSSCMSGRYHPRQDLLVLRTTNQRTSDNYCPSEPCRMQSMCTRSPSPDRKERTVQRPHDRVGQFTLRFLKEAGRSARSRLVTRQDRR